MNAVTRDAFADELLKLGSPEESRMTPEKWKRALKDTAVGVTGMGLGMGLGTTAAWLAKKKIPAGAPVPGWVRHAPAIATAVGGVGALSSQALMHHLRRRREQAEAEATANAGNP